jgi:hypothetical protein
MEFTSSNFFGLGGNKIMVTQEEFKSMFKIIDGITFTPEANFLEKEIEKDGVKSTEIFYEITKSIDDVYSEFLNPKSPELNQMDILKQQILNLENYLLEKETAETIK